MIDHFRKSASLTAFAVGLSLAAGAAFASGSDGAGSAQTGDAAAYNIGKGVYATRLACADCPLAGKSLDESIARDLLAGKPEVTLSADESAALKVYLSRRFKR
jgi:hypothetical protein